jgi:hypothetical protein
MLHHVLDCKAVQDRQYPIDHRGAGGKLSPTELSHQLMKQWVVELHKRNIGIEEPDKTEQLI